MARKFRVSLQIASRTRQSEMIIAEVLDIGMVVIETNGSDRGKLYWTCIVTRLPVELHGLGAAGHVKPLE